MKRYTTDGPRREILDKDEMYPVATEDQQYLAKGAEPSKVKAKWTGEKRPPKAGEWYLSGAIIEAYRAPSDLSTPHAIAKLYRPVAEFIRWEEL